MSLKKIICVCVALFSCLGISNAQAKKIIVAQTGPADFKSIQAAIASLSDSSTTPRIIYIKKGTYNEKIYIEKHNIIFEGEDKDATIVTYAVARDEWKCEHPGDWGVATVNIDGNDITFKNLTFINSYGFDWKADKTIYCPTDTFSDHLKKVNRFGHQMTVRTMKATRFKAINCVFRSYAGDTMSPWNVKYGLFYFKDCTMEGGVDFYCPRGWAYADNCKFIATRGDAAIWHDGSHTEDSKTVLNNCSFEGYDGFRLGRYHRDAQFYLLNCSFAANMKDTTIYRVATKNIIRWGHRVYFYNCHKKGGDYAWFGDNLQSAKDSPDPKKINPYWVFGNRWNPLID